MGTTPALTIGRLAKAAGVGIDTVRYYERAGLLPAPARSASGYRRYGQDELSRLRFIRRAQRLGFSLAEIDGLLALSRQRDIAAVRRQAAEKLADVDARIRELERVREALGALFEACPGHERDGPCPILSALGEEDQP